MPNRFLKQSLSFFLANFLKKCKALKIHRKFKELFSKYPWIYPPNLTDVQSLGYIWFRWILWTKTPKVQLKCLLVSSPSLSLKSVCFLHIHVFILSVDAHRSIKYIELFCTFKLYWRDIVLDTCHPAIFLFHLTLWFQELSVLICVDLVCSFFIAMWCFTAWMCYKLFILFPFDGHWALFVIFHIADFCVGHLVHMCGSFLRQLSKETQLTVS